MKQDVSSQSVARAPSFSDAYIWCPAWAGSKVHIQSTFEIEACMSLRASMLDIPSWQKAKWPKWPDLVPGAMNIESAAANTEKGNLDCIQFHIIQGVAFTMKTCRGHQPNSWAAKPAAQSVNSAKLEARGPNFKSACAWWLVLSLLSRRDGCLSQCGNIWAKRKSEIKPCTYIFLKSCYWIWVCPLRCVNPIYLATLKIMGGHKIYLRS